mmetsp:Transcript_7957/g.35320  ORF Transcript_7957/g.35320 Transcript_7957/m.35320 type:complete len:96 (-) Transcript_7957:1192-1479(-)
MKTLFGPSGTCVDTIPRSDGLNDACADRENQGVHEPPVPKIGKEEIGAIHVQAARRGERRSDYSRLVSAFVDSFLEREHHPSVKQQLPLPSFAIR